MEEAAVLTRGHAPWPGACLPKTPNRQSGDTETAQIQCPGRFLVLPTFTFKREVQRGRRPHGPRRQFLVVCSLIVTFCPLNLEHKTHF